MAETMETSKHEFKAEVRQLLDILARSLYTNKEIFLRELISNASDALDKLRFEVNRGTEVVDDNLELEIRINFDKDAGILRVSDTGIGMTREELMDDIGTIARSGSASFIEAAEDKDTLDGIIGKFGVGFYSVFMVAKKVVIQTRSWKADATPIRWESDGTGSFEIGPASTPDLRRGTTVELHLLDDDKEYCEDWRLKDIIKRHSSFISFPIFVKDERINTIPALWREPKFNIKAEQYEDFYKFLTFDSGAPFETIHVSVDAPVQYNALLFIPPTGLDLLGLQKERPGLDLYIRRVLIQRGNKDLIPEYLGFVRGVVDSEDLPLNISRETLQENRNLIKITSNVTKQILTHLEKLAKNDGSRYEEFWKTHGKIFKLGYTDFPNQEKYASLLRFNSSHCDNAEELVSLDDYIERAKEEQKTIYFATGASRAAFGVNPHMEIFRSKGLEVLYLLDPLDEFALEALRKYKDYELKSIEHADAGELAKFDDVEEEKSLPDLEGDEAEAFDDLQKRIKKILGEKITDVRVSTRLRESPCRLVSPDGAMSSSMQRMLQIAGQDSSVPAKVFEINKDHPLIRNLVKVYGSNPDDEYLRAVVEQLFESSLMLEGYLNDPHSMVDRIQKLLNQSSDWYLAVKKIE